MGLSLCKSLNFCDFKFIVVMYVWDVFIVYFNLLLRYFVKFYIKRFINIFFEYYRLIWILYMFDGEEFERIEEFVVEEGRLLVIIYGN